MIRIFQRVLSALLSVIIGVGGSASMSLAASNTDSATGTQALRFSQDFNACATDTAFTDTHTDFNISYVQGTMQVVGDTDRTVRIQTCDMRWWAMDYTDKLMNFAFMLSFDGSYSDTRLVFNATNDNASTTTESPEGGRLISVESNGGQPYLADRDGNRLTDFAKDGTKYRILIQTEFGGDRYSVYCNDILLSDQCRFISPIYAIYGARFHGTGSNGSYLTLDDIVFYTLGRAYPQKYSYDEVGPLPEITIPDAVTDDGTTTFWINDTRYERLEDRMFFASGTAYLPLTDAMTAAGGTVNGKTLTSPDGTAYILEEDRLLYGETVTPLTHEIKTVDGVLYAPMEVFTTVLCADVWHDEFHNTVVLSTGKYKNDGILRKLGSVLWQNGAPYWEISFNKFDLNWQILADPSLNDGNFPDASFPEEKYCIAGAEEALQQLHNNGFRTIRVFCNSLNPGKSEAEWDRFWKAADLMYDLCDQYEIQVVACLNLNTSEFLAGKYPDSGKWITTGEQFYDYFCDPNSESRQLAYTFIDRYVSRYRDRDTILMWEITNEGNLDADIGGETKKITFSLGQLGAFYSDMAARIRQNDPERLISGGDSVLRSEQWNLYAGTKRGDETANWTVDTLEERLKALSLLHENLDVISVHGYKVGYVERYRDEDGSYQYVSYSLFLQEAERLGLSLYNGEAGGQLSESSGGVELPNTGDASAEARARYLDTIVNAGVQITHWWAFHSDRYNFGLDVDSWGVRTDDDTAGTFQAICEANRKLRERYAVNGLGKWDSLRIRVGQPLTMDDTYVYVGAKTTTDALKNAFYGQVSLTQSRESPYAGTGNTVTLGEDTRIVMIVGDLNGNGYTDSNDYLLARAAMLKKSIAPTDETALLAADVNGNGRTDSNDCLLLRRCLLQKYLEKHAWSTNVTLMKSYTPQTAIVSAPAASFAADMIAEVLGKYGTAPERRRLTSDYYAFRPSVVLEYTDALEVGAYKITVDNLGLHVLANGEAAMLAAARVLCGQITQNTTAGSCVIASAQLERTGSVKN